MAGGWTRDGAVQDQIDASVEDAVRQTRSKIATGVSAMFCEECAVAIPEKRREAILGVQLCVTCQSRLEERVAVTGGFNRRGSKDSQLR